MFCTRYCLQVRATAGDHRAVSAFVTLFCTNSCKVRRFTGYPREHLRSFPQRGAAGGLGARGADVDQAALGRRPAAVAGRDRAVGSFSAPRISASETFSGWWQAARWPFGVADQRRLLLAADLGGARAARMEDAAGRRVDRVGRLARHDDPLAAAVLLGSGSGSRPAARSCTGGSASCRAPRPARPPSACRGTSPRSGRTRGGRPTGRGRRTGRSA